MNEQEPNQPSQQPPVSDATSQAEAWPTTASAAPAKSSNVARWWVGAAIAVVLITVGAVGVMFYKNASLSERQIPDAQVTIEKGAFTPTTIKVQKGQAVTWHNKDETNHRLTAEQDSIKSFNTADSLKNGDSYTYVFEKAGTFAYYDSLNPTSLKGIVIVE